MGNSVAARSTWYAARGVVRLIIGVCCKFEIDLRKKNCCFPGGRSSGRIAGLVFSRCWQTPYKRNSRVGCGHGPQGREWRRLSIESLNSSTGKPRKSDTMKIDRSGNGLPIFVTLARPPVFFQSLRHSCWYWGAGSYSAVAPEAVRFAQKLAGDGARSFTPALSVENAAWLWMGSWLTIRGHLLRAPLACPIT